MLLRILAPLDGSPLSACALPYVAALARLTNAEVYLLRVLEHDDSSTQAIDPLDWHLLKLEARIYLGEVAARLQTLIGREAHVEVMEGCAASSIVNYAEQQGINLIVLSSHGRSGLSAWNTGSVAQKVIQRAGCSVFLTRAYAATECEHKTFEAARFCRLAVPLDGSQRAEAVLPLATALVQQHGAELHLVHVVRPPELLARGPHSRDDAQLVSQVVERNRAAATHYFEQLETRLPADAQSHVLVDFDVMMALHEFVALNDIDLVLATAHGYSANTQRPYGTVGTNIVVYGTTSLLVIQDAPREEREPGPVERLFGNIDLLERTRIHTRTQPEAML